MNEAVKKYNALSTITVVSAVVFLVLRRVGGVQFEWAGACTSRHRGVCPPWRSSWMLVAFVYMNA